VKKTGIRFVFPVLVSLILVVLSACSSPSSSSSLSSQTSTAVTSSPISSPSTSSSSLSSQTSTAVTSSVVSSTASSSSPTASPVTQNTFGALAISGETIYTKYGARCHGESGQGRSGPVLIGSSAGLVKYNTAKGLLDYIVRTMPLGAPGSLSHQDYLDILCFLLIQNNYVSADTVFDEAQLSNITLK
jgi:hypothetical protein